MIEAVFTVTEDDVAAAVAYAAAHTRWYVSARRSQSALALACFVLAGVGLAYWQWHERFFALVALAASTGVGTLAAWDLWITYPERIGEGVRRFSARYPTPASRGEIKLKVAPDGLTIASDRACSRFAWSAFVRLGETGAHIFLFVGPVSVIPIAKASLRGVSSEALLGEIRAHGEFAA